MVTKPSALREVRVNLAPPKIGGGSGGRKVAPRNSLTSLTGAAAFQSVHVSDFGSDLGRKKFGFSREELETFGAYYEGQFKLYQRSGYGTIYFPNTGERYIGQFSNDLFHGEGFRVWSDGSEYRGHWVNGQKSGQGEYVSPENLRYVGQWEAGRRNGRGVQEYANGDRYEGGWVNGMNGGMGTYHFADGSRYEGAWSRGSYDGSGTYYKLDGTKERHVYKRGVLQSRDVVMGSQAVVTTREELEAAMKAPASSLLRSVTKQLREDMQERACLPPLEPSRHLIKRNWEEELAKAAQEEEEEDAKKGRPRQQSEGWRRPRAETDAPVELS